MPDASAAPPSGAGGDTKRKTTTTTARGSSSTEADDIGRVTVLDVLRVLGGLVLLSFALSWFVTGESVLWGWRPWFSRVDGIKAWMRGPVLLTDEQLAAYDGSDPSKPIYLALNGTIYDVSPGRHFYGPGGGYHFFAGRDAARAFVTGCFEEDLTPDLRGVEEMYIPTDEPEDEEVNSKLSPAEIKNRNAKERREAKKKVDGVIEGWAKVFSGETGKDYLPVGKVVREEGWLEKLPRRELCKKAAELRPKGRVKKKKGKKEEKRKD
ncbi:cytochrome b5-like heme/steroid binding domain-containing protein [Macrophomina phaseolina]|uniref:Cytochrome b5-like heme/steroid binding domain-containing protein n=1 Tax=Macrophomina phaseolina TaxID=35725 RepID=A0ABQ8GHA8_9PEZI|nr:cytochrome b5-like heme/steroid binding domain-containing protein [Macrophomina phaseolina]